MSGDAARALDPEFPNLAPEVVAGYRSAPEHLVAEIIDGSSRSCRGRAAALAGSGDRTRTASCAAPSSWARRPGGWVFLPEPELHLGPRPDIVIPDLAGWRTERTPPGFLADDAAGIALAPDWVCEVLSPSTASTDRTKKLPIYRREGVGHAWLIDPTAHTLEVFRRHDLGWLLIASFEGASVVRAEPFDAIALDLAGLWVD
jgi:Uma2 family endonuclease